MRFQVDVAATGSQMAWPDVHGAARGVLYNLLSAQDPVLAAELHDSGWNGTSLRPLGVCPPVFSGAPRQKGVYTTSGRGSIRLGSPVPRIAGCLLAALGGASELHWGQARMKVKGVRLDETPDHSAATAVFETASPIVVKHDSRFLVPGDEHFEERLAHNISHKADVLGLPPQARVKVLKSGKRRKFATSKGFRIGAPATVRVDAAPPLLDALYDWGLGLATNQGFGWVK